MRPGAGRDLAPGAAAAFAFGCTILFNRYVARDGLPSSVALGVRFGVAGLLLLGVLAALRRPLLPPRGERVAALVVGFVIYSIESTLFYMGLQRGTAAAVALIFYAYPAVVAVAEVALGVTRWRARTALALGLAISGSAVVAVGGGHVVISAAGVACVCGSIATFATYVLVSDRVLVQTDALTVAVWTALGASVGTTAIGVAAGNLRAPSTAGATAALFGNGVATAAAFTLFFVALGRMGATRTAIVMALEAVFGVVLTAVFLGESVKPVVALGGGVVLAGAVFAALAAPVSVEAQESATPP